MKPEGFPAIFRLRKRRDFLRVQNGGQKHHTRHFLVFVAPAGQTPAGDQQNRVEEPAAMVRLGITVTRKVGPAVVRNRIKRLVREAFRRKRSQFASPCDMVWVAKQSASTVRYAEVVAAMDAMSRRISPRPAGPGTPPRPTGPGPLPGSSAC
ncbi:ribonuclease P protein component [Nannocystis exedens]|uniref:ribonuclease P protein component n=1 Tax=Nannocystis exedens TaxID=54 RepID=UPI000BBA058D